MPEIWQRKYLYLILQGDGRKEGDEERKRDLDGRLGDVLLISWRYFTDKTHCIHTTYNVPRSLSPMGRTAENIVLTQVCYNLHLFLCEIKSRESLLFALPCEFPVDLWSKLKTDAWMKMNEDRWICLIKRLTSWTCKKLGHLNHRDASCA